MGEPGWGGACRDRAEITDKTNEPRARSRPAVRRRVGLLLYFFGVCAVRRWVRFEEGAAVRGGPRGAERSGR